MNPWVHPHGHWPKIYGRYIWVPRGINHITRWCDTPVAFCILATHIKKRKAINHQKNRRKPCRSRHKDVVATLNSDVAIQSQWKCWYDIETRRCSNVIATSRQRCINVRTTANDVDKRLFKRRNATLERCISTLYQHFHYDYIATSCQRRYSTSFMVV